MQKLHYQTGPVTVAGKEISSRNATTHGGTSEKLIVAGERREDFDALLEELLAEFAPATVHACGLVEDAAIARWLLWRKQRAYHAVESAIYEAEPDAAKWPLETHHRLALAERYRTASERALKRALTNLDSLRKESQRESDRRDRTMRWEAVHQLNCRRLELQEKRLEIAVKREARLGRTESAPPAKEDSPASASLLNECFQPVDGRIPSLRDLVEAPVRHRQASRLQRPYPLASVPAAGH
jgi:hypothetical protein